MSHRFLCTTSLAASSLLLIAGGIVAAGCGSDKDTNSTGEMLTPGDGMGTEGNANGGSGTSSQPGNDDEPGGTATNGGSSSTNEGQGGSVPIGNDPDNPPGSGNSGGSGNPDEPPVNPPEGGLAPNCNPPEGAVPDLALELVADGLNQPLYVTGVPGDDSRLFIVDKAGAVRVVVNGELQQAPFIDITGQVMNNGERGLLGLAFHPNYQSNGLFYLHYSSNQGATSGDGIVAEFSRDANDPNVGNPGSQRNLLVFDDPESNHNGGDLEFGPDGFLYIGLGDGGGGGDQHGAIGNGQNLSTLFGKIMRIDPLGRSVNGAYDIPPGNLVDATGQQALPEIWAYGVRNPWRFSFDACTGDLYIGDVGQNLIEEIDFVAADATTKTIGAGLNFGWRIMEAEACFNAQTCNQGGLTLPVDSYPRNVGTSVTGGYVYRGSNVPGLRGQYIYADYNSGRFFRFRMNNGQLTEHTEITDEMRVPGGGNVTQIASFGTDNGGEVYIAAFNGNAPGAVYRVAAAQ